MGTIPSPLIFNTLSIKYSNADSIFNENKSFKKLIKVAFATKFIILLLYFTSFKIYDGNFPESSDLENYHHKF